MEAVQFRPTDMKLLTRDQFREGVFARDKNKCVLCGEPAQDAHHILERRLWSNGGYFIENGASVCGECHMKCETTEISVEDVRHAAGITKIVVPDHLYPDQPYDKWGNPVLPNGQRARGELFFDESVQKVIAPYLDLFTHYIKYPRTYHLPWSECIPDDDRAASSMAHWEGKRVIVTVKMDGENTSMYTDYFHARSVDSQNHPSRNWAKNAWSQFAGDIPEGWRVCAENLYAQHSIAYEDLPSYLMGFSVWNERNVCLSWDETVEWMWLFGLPHVPVLYDGIYDEKKIKALWDPSMRDSCEGYVLRLADEFDYSQFRTSVAKFVRKDHVQTNKHWMHGQRIIPNGLKK